MTSWKGRFRKSLHPAALAFSSSLHVDKRLFREDIEGSIAHVTMLAKQKILSAGEAGKIRSGLREILRELSSGKHRPGSSGHGDGRFIAEDIHMAIEHRLIQKVGRVGGKLHTARSRNDQVALDERLYLRSTAGALISAIRVLQRVLVAKAATYESVVMPGYTHLQRAQPILLAHHLLAYVEMLARDEGRFSDLLRRVDQSPLGAAALAGTSFPIHRLASARALGFSTIIANSIDAVSDRDVHIEFLSCCAVTMMHLSRLAEELVLWSSQEWRFAVIDDAFTTGSSIMPQKKNPDMAELVRGKTGRVYGDLLCLLTVMKGLPLAYNRDMQEDKPALFDAADTTSDCLKICSLMIRSMTFTGDRFEEELGSDFSVATDLADYLVQQGVPFREAHGTVGKIVAQCVQERKKLSDVSLKDLRRFSKHFGNGVARLLDIRKSLTEKKSAGSTSPREVRKAIRVWKKRLGTRRGNA